MNYVIAGIILLFWIYISMSFSWDPNSSRTVNLIVGLGCVILLGLIYWVPFWLIFMR